MRLWKTKTTMVAVLLLSMICLFSGSFLDSAMAAGNEEIRGVVTDSAGKPIRAAIVRATLGSRSIARFTDKDGRYQISGLDRTTYEVSAEAYGFGAKKQSKNVAQGGATNFAMASEWDETRLSTAEILTALPWNQETRFLNQHCSNCHGLVHVLPRRGWRSEQWQAKIKIMGAGILFPLRFSDNEMKYVGGLLEKYFGPNSSQMRPEQVKRVEVSDIALKATFHEFTLPGAMSLPHSVAPDADGNAWFAEYSYMANKFGFANFETGEIKEYPVPIPESGVHTPIVDKQGKVWMTLALAGRLSVWDPTTGKINIFPDAAPGAHTPALDAEGNVWMSGEKLYRFNRRTERVQTFEVHVPKEVPAESVAAYGAVPGETPRDMNAGTYLGTTYHVQVDSQGKVWYTQARTGYLANFDPTTGETKLYKPAGVPSAKGIAVDAEDNIWYSAWYGFKLARLNPKTGETKLYQPPTQYASPYGVVRDKKTGYIWYGDFLGNNITRFDPKTEQFVEYPIPTPSTMPRFISVDDKGRVWFCEWWKNKVGVLIPDGA